MGIFETTTLSMYMMMTMDINVVCGIFTELSLESQKSAVNIET